MPRNLNKKLVVLAFVTISFTTTAAAQAPVQSPYIEGTVTIRNKDGSSKPVAGALVDIYRIDTTGHWEVMTGSTGYYIIGGIPQQGTYIIAVSGPGMNPVWIKKASLTKSRNTMNFESTPGNGIRLTLEQALYLMDPFNNPRPPTTSVPNVQEDKRPNNTLDDRTNRVSEAATEKRVALIIGISAYANAPLRNPVNDVREMARALRTFGFEVIERENVTKREMEEQIRAFGKQLKAGGVGLFYFSGHGLQVNGSNYLLPVGYNIEKEQDVEYEAVEAGRVLAEMEAAENRLNIVILDACRNNPFTRSFRSDTRGLAIMKAPSGSLVAYSTGPGSVASDGEGENGLYTQELLNSIRTPGLKLEDVFKKVRVAVKAKSGGKQIPWETSALEGDFYFSYQPVATSIAGNFSTPRAGVETFLAAAQVRNLDLLSQCFAQNSEGEFAPLRNKTAGQKELDSLAEFAQGAIVTGVRYSQKQDAATVLVKFRSRDEEIHMVKTETGWKIQGF